MPVLPHNQRAISNLTALHGRRTSYYSASIPGLTLEIMPTGKKTWRFRYRTVGGRKGETRAYTIGDGSSISLGEAIDKAREIKAAIQLDGRDPHKERAIRGETFGDLFDDWLDRHAKPKKKSWPHDEALYHRHIRSRLGNKSVADIKRADVGHALDDIARSATGTQANRAQSLISAILNWAVNEGRLEHSPTFRLPKRALESPRERVLNPNEVRLFWKGLDDGPVGLEIVRILSLALLLGQRRSEITEVRKSELVLEGSEPVWVIPGSRTKNGMIHRVPLPNAALKIFTSAVADSGTPFVFPGRGTEERAISPHAVTRAMARLTLELGIENATVHDLRRTVGTNLARLGVSKDIRARILNHVDGVRSVTDAVYNQHEFMAEKRAALELWEAELKRIMKQEA